ncbi:MAG: NFACT RNA binding domain-containing protein [Chloroflexota bacterium]
MSFDGLTLSAVVAELGPLLRGARVQKIVLIDELSLALETFAPGVGRTDILLSADLDAARVHRLTALPRRGLQRDTPFALLARKHVRSARITGLHQPPLERVFALQCEHRDASGTHYRLTCIVEAMGRRSNLVLLDEQGVIIDAARRAPPSRNPRRPILPHLPYSPPPPQERLLPADVSHTAFAEAWARAPAERRRNMARFLSDTLAGVSPLAGRELAFRAFGAADPGDLPDWDHVATTVHEFYAPLTTHEWHPTVAFDSGDGAIAYAPYRLTHLEAGGARLEPFASISAAIETARAHGDTTSQPRRGDTLAAERKTLLAPLERALTSAERRAVALEVQLEGGHAQREPLRRAGELILTHQADIASGAGELVVDGEHIALQIDLSPSENAQAYFARYRKAREAEERVPALLDVARQRVSHLRDLQALVDVADSMDAVRALRREVGAVTSPAQVAGADTKNRGAGRDTTQKRPGGPYRRVTLDNDWEALVGTSANGNAAVTFDLAQPDDLWLHARQVPGAHVILRSNGRTPPDVILERAAQLAAEHSAARHAGSVDVDVALKRYVKKVPGGLAGLVRYSNERTLRVSPRT